MCVLFSGVSHQRPGAGRAPRAGDRAQAQSFTHEDAVSDASDAQRVPPQPQREACTAVGWRPVHLAWTVYAGHRWRQWSSGNSLSTTTASTGVDPGRRRAIASPIKILGWGYLFAPSVLAIFWALLCPECVCVGGSAPDPAGELTALLRSSSSVGEGSLSRPQKLPLSTFSLDFRPSLGLCQGCLQIKFRPSKVTWIDARDSHLGRLLDCRSLHLFVCLFVR